jgi:hypothetical protein
MLKVVHRGEAKHVGKVFPARGHDIFLHESVSNQHHRNLDSPGGVDVCVVEYLGAIGVPEVHHYERDTKTLFVARLQLLEQNAIFQGSDGRFRLYLPTPFWIRSTGLDYTVPWVRDEHTLDPTAPTLF